MDEKADNLRSGEQSNRHNRNTYRTRQSINYLYRPEISLQSVFIFIFFFTLASTMMEAKKKWKSRENCCNWKFLLLLLVAQYWQSQAKALTEFLISFSFHQQMTQLVVSCTRPPSSSHVVGCFLFLARAIASEFMKYRIFQPKTLEKNLVKWSFFFCVAS